MSQIRKGAVASYISVVFNIVSGLLFTPFLIRKVGSGAYGLYILVTTFQNYFLLDFGLGNSVAKFLSEFNSRNDKDKVADFIAVVIKLYILIAVTVGLILMVLYFFLEKFFIGLSIDEVIVLRKMYVLSGVSSVLLFVFVPLDGILTAHELFFELKTIELLRKVFIIILSVLVLMISTNVILVIAINAIVGAMIVILKLSLINRKCNIEINWGCFDKEILRMVGTFSLWQTIIMLAQRFIIPIAPTILGRFSNSVEISKFSIATTVEGYIYTIAACLNGLFLPRLTSIRINGNVNDINQLFIKVGRIQTYIIGAILFALIVFGKEFILLWVGQDFLDSYWIIILLSSSTIVVYSQEIANSIMMVDQKLAYKAMCYSVGALVSTTVGILLAPKMGGIGVALGIAICLWGFQVFIMNLIYSRFTDLNIKGFFEKCYYRYIPIMATLSAAFYFLNQFILYAGLLFFVLKIVLFEVVSILLLWLIDISKSEKKEILDEFRKILRLIE